MNFLYDIVSHARILGLGVSGVKSTRVRFSLILGSNTCLLDHGVPQEFLLPRAVSRTSDINPNLLFDGDKWLLDLYPKDEKSAARVEAFWDKNRKFIHGSANARAIKAFEASFSTREKWMGRVVSAFQKVDSDGVNIALAVEDGDESLPLSHLLRSYVDSEHARSFNPGNHTCCLTGVSCTRVRVHNRVRGVPGTTESGGSLVSWPEPSSQFDDRDKGDHVFISPLAVWAYKDAIESMYARDGFHRHQSAVDLQDGYSVCWWVHGKKAPAWISALMGGASGMGDMSDEEYQSSMKEHGVQAWSEAAASTESEDALHVLALRGSNSKVSQTGYSKTTVGAVARRLIAVRQEFFPDYDGSAFLFTKRLCENQPGKKDSPRSLEGRRAVAIANYLLAGSTIPTSMVKYCLAAPLRSADERYLRARTSWQNYMSESRAER